MKRYFVEFGPQHNRVFLNNPPARPLGKVVEVTYEELEELNKTDPSTWKPDTGKPRSVWRLRHKALLLNLLILAIGLGLGILLGRY